MRQKRINEVKIIKLLWQCDLAGFFTPILRLQAQHTFQNLEFIFEEKYFIFMGGVYKTNLDFELKSLEYT